jgi:hypothetical protein
MFEVMPKIKDQKTLRAYYVVGAESNKVSLSTLKDVLVLFNDKEDK